MTRKAPLFTIRPDPDQPRTLLPPDLVGLFTNGLMSPQAIYACWQKSPNSQFAEIVRLANSIAQHGQINPISVRVAKNNLPGVEYLIVTGERRWWAHVLLWTQGRNIMEGGTRGPADQIKISLVAKGISIRAHQLIENVVREDLGAVEKAHGMWALRYELSGKNYCSTMPTSAQEKQLVGWDQVEKSLGVSNRYRQYVISVLKLTPDALRLVAEHGLSESTIRPITQKLHKYPDLQMKALRQLIAWQGSEEHHSLVKEVKQLVNDLVAEIPPATPTPRPNLLPLELSKNRKAEASKAPPPPPSATAQAVTSAQAEVTAPSPYLESEAGPIQAVTAAPMPELAQMSRESPPESSQESFITQNQTLRNRPTFAWFPHATNLRSAITELTETLDRIKSLNPQQVACLMDSREELVTLKSQIDQVLLRLTPQVGDLATQSVARTLPLLRGDL